MKLAIRSVFILSILISTIALAQQPDSLIKKLDSAQLMTDSAGGQTNVINRKAYNERTEIHFDTYFILLTSNFKQQLTAPFHLTKKDWIKVGKFGVVLVGVGLLDESIQRFGQNLRDNNKGVRVISNRVTNLGAQYEGITLIALGTYGFLFKNEKIQTTTLLASQAYITSSVMESLLKAITGRQRPSYYDPIAKEAEPRFHGPIHKPFKDVSGKTISSSFPSGHAAAAFAAATVYAMEYKDRPLVPIISYTTASLIALSRITENRHWATDIVAGSTMGFLIGRQVVNNYHRYAKLQEEKRKKNSVSFQLQYNFGHLMPGIVYTFK
ncbi:phosphatase PAP2 family protein [Chitinophagaceae bacterium LB-8]|uniref:Phosphatase PAP2 family protein n=1 Tax=Paraflavisolibacter caeni TaxID=2982496 RepID=A0A9X3BH83_9BACT|nr:phosphatase PAP2 family protein [Paraflavisolibacter caeni]MCU7549112.1 phosphatase PAP2 family protein [Paraflavisolibacter caeni]